MIYLDSAATSLLKPKAVRAAMLDALGTMASPGRGGHLPAMRAADRVYECRELLGELFHFEQTERIVFTQNATHALNIAIRSLASNGDRVVISGYEHNAVTRTLYGIGADVHVAAGTLFDAESVKKAFAEELSGAKLAILNHVSNVFGFIQPVYEIADLCRENAVPLIVDASQSAGLCNIDAERLGAAFVAMPGHKGLLGPQGTGVLLCGTDAKPLLYGGTGSDSILQTMPEFYPDRLEAGTHNVVGIAGLCEGVKYILKHGAENIGSYETELCQLAARQLQSIPDAEVFSSDKAQAGVLSFRVRGLSCETLCEKMGRAGIAARCGLHCAPLAHETVSTLDTGTVRLSFSPFVSKAQVTAACRNIAKIVYEK